MYHLDEKHLLFIGLPLWQAFSISEVYLMQVNCPYCHSEHVIRVVQNSSSQGGNQSLASSASFATMGAALSKTLPVSPFIGGIAGAVVGGLLGSVFGSDATQTVQSCFQCQHCGQLFH